MGESPHACEKLPRLAVTVKRITKKAARVKAKAVAPPKTDRHRVLDFEREQWFPDQGKKWNVETRSTILDNVSRGARRKVAFGDAGVSTRTVETWLARARAGEQDFIDFFEAIEMHECKFELAMQTNIFLQARGATLRKNKKGEVEVVEGVAQPNYKAAMTLLQHGPGRDHWKPVERREHTGANGGPIQVDQFASWTDDELKAFIAGKEAKQASTSPRAIGLPQDAESFFRG